MRRQRDYAKEYREYHGKPEQIKRRSGRNQARRKMVAAGKAHKGDGKDVSHKNRNANDNRMSNLTMKSKSKNRGDHKGRSYK